MDQTTNIETLKLIIKDFCHARDWDQFHSIKDLSIGLSTEANELLELFRFKSDSEINEKLQNKEFAENIQHELADAFFFILRISQKYDIDLTTAFLNKMKINNQKYSVEKVKGL